MSTNAIIAVKHGTNFKSIYCHFDGYPEGVGKTLYEHYDSPKANHLVALGNVSFLEKEIIPKTETHTGKKPEPDVTVFYGRDFNEPNTEFKCYTTEAEFLDRRFTRHFYVMDNGSWTYYNGYTKEWKPLATVLSDLEKTK